MKKIERLFFNGLYASEIILGWIALILTCAFGLSLFVEETEGRTITVAIEEGLELSGDDEGGESGGEGESGQSAENRPCDFTHIMDAIVNASDGDRIVILSGVYRENLTIEGEIELVSIEEQNGSAMDPGDNDSAPTISPVTVDGWIRITNATGTELDGLTILKGVQVKDSEDVRITHCVIGTAGGPRNDGITIEDSLDGLVDKCQLKKISIISSLNNLVRGNHGFEDAPLEITLADRFHLGVTTHNQILDNECSYIGLSYADRNYIVNNTCSDSVWVGIYMDHGAHNTISLNRCMNNAVYGIYVDSYSRFNRLSQNICTGNNNTGIYLYYCWYNDLIENDCSGNGKDGIQLDVANVNTAAFNTCTGNGRYGINVLYYRKEDRDRFANVLTRNSVSGNRKGIHEDVEKSFWGQYLSFECFMCYFIISASLYPVIRIAMLHQKRKRIIARNKKNRELVHGQKIGTIDEENGE